MDTNILRWIFFDDNQNGDVFAYPEYYKGFARERI